MSGLREPEVVLPDDLLPDGEQPVVGLRETLRQGGWSICLLAIPLVMMEQLGRDSTNTLAPDLRDFFGISNAMLVAITGFSGVTLTLGGLLMAWLADRLRRKTLVVGSAAVGTLAMVSAGLAQNPLQLFIAFAFLGFAGAYSGPVFGSLIADAYPVGGRGRIYSLQAMATPLGQALGPAFAGAVAGLAGGPQAWRWVYLALAVPYAALAISAAVGLREPARGQADGVHLVEHPAVSSDPVGLVVAFRRMMKVKTFLFLCLGMGVLGLALYTIPVQMSLLLRDEYRFGAVPRGVIFSLVQVPVIAVMIYSGRHFDRVFRRRPERTMHLAGGAVLLFGILTVFGVWLQPIALLLACYVLASMCVGIALVAVNPLVSAVTPYRLRAQAFAVLPVFTFLMGGFFGSIFAGMISGMYGPRLAITIAVALSAFLGGGLLLQGERYLGNDIAEAVAEIRERVAEPSRLSDGPKEDRGQKLGRRSAGSDSDSDPIGPNRSAGV